MPAPVEGFRNRGARPFDGCCGAGTGRCYIPAASGFASGIGSSIVF
jgi:hypothetical protein